MRREITNERDPGPQSGAALATWDDEGGAQPLLDDGDARADLPDVSNAELKQLRIRVIALENVLIALLLSADDQRLDDVRRMAATLVPRVGMTPHPVTNRAAEHMLQLVDRAAHYRVPRKN